ncbi:MAG: translation elongation factor Ts [Treponema sp.]
MDIKASDIKELREKTGAGMMECKKALIEANGDAGEAEKILKEKGLAAVAKRSDRATGEGRIFIKQDGNKIAMVELTCETDFVAGNKDFIEVGEKIAELAVKSGKEGVSDEQNALMQELAIKIRENMAVRRSTVVEIPAGAAASTYIHHNFKIGSVVVVNGSTDERVTKFVHECCLHLAANTPFYIKKDDVPADYVAEQTEIFRKQMEDDPKVSGKPESVKEGILKGKVSKHLAEICFMDQMFIDDEKKSVEAKLAETGKEVGASLAFGKIELFVLGK